MSLFEQVYQGISSVSVNLPGEGDVLINAGSEPGQVRCTIDEWDANDPYALRVEQRDDRLTISADRVWGRGSNSDVFLELPAGLDVEVTTQSGDVVINADLGSSRIATGSGDIAVGTARALSAKSGSGDIAAGTVTDAAEITTGSGDIVVREATGPVTAKSGSGDVQLTRLRAATLSVSTGSGDISAASTTGSVDLRSASGSIEVGVADGLPAWLDLNTVNGDIRIDLDASQQPEDGQPYVTVRCRTASGEIDIHRARD